VQEGQRRCRLGQEGQEKEVMAFLGQRRTGPLVTCRDSDMSSRSFADRIGPTTNSCRSSRSNNESFYPVPRPTTCLFVSPHFDNSPSWSFLGPVNNYTRQFGSCLGQQQDRFDWFLPQPTTPTYLNNLLGHPNPSSTNQIFVGSRFELSQNSKLGTKGAKYLK